MAVSEPYIKGVLCHERLSHLIWLHGFCERKVYTFRHRIRIHGLYELTHGKGLSFPVPKKYAIILP